MTTVEAQDFVEKVLQGLWSVWKPKDEELSLWIERLRIYDYELCRQAIRNWYMQQRKSTMRPPMGLVLNVFRKTLQGAIANKKNEPVLLYTIAKERLMKHGKGFYVGTSRKVPSSEEIECRAEKDRRQANYMYQENHVVIQDWKALGIK